MYILNYKNEVVFFNKDKYAFEYDMYIDLWKIKYDIDLCLNKNDVLKDIVNFINNS